MDQLESMAVFVQVAEKKSFATAAAALDLSATMVANHVRALEARLGTRLIERTTRRHMLTDVGAAYLERCRDILASVEAADGVAEAVRTQPTGVLRVTAPVTYGAHRLIPVIADYCQRFPEVHVELDLNDRVVDLEEEGFHIGLRSGRIRNERLVSLPLRQSTMMAAANPAYLERHGVPQHPADLRAHNCLAFAIWGRNHIWSFTRSGETVAVPVNGRLTVNSGQALLQAALACLGVIVQADVLLEQAFARGTLVRLLPEWELPTRPICLVYSPRTPRNAKLNSFVEFVAAQLA